MVVFLYGPDDYCRHRKAQEVVAEFIRKHPAAARDRFDFLEEGDIDRAEVFMQNQPIFEPWKLALLGGVFASPYEEKAKSILASARQDTRTLVVVSEEREPAAAFSFLLKPPILSQKFPHLSGRARREFTEEEAKRRGVRASADALARLSRAYEKNGWGLATELEKLACLKSGSVELKDLDSAAFDAAPDMWGLVLGLKSQSVAHRLASLERLELAHEPEAKVFNILSAIWKEKITQFADYDLKIKSGKLDYEEALVDAVL